ncbi:MAG: polysaccharide biosynthesis tyrosine autokinase, partial [Phycisphaerae bacterium]|nr:polysaccharide biosynthesis tyrosine autokinase [Phycisphaerae bacterium]MDW8262482.1 polysaccharide biosynthesis tyrosine autokinase [Phycisphaerales bacterium]
GRGDELITLSLRTPYPAEGVKLLNSINEAYEAFQKKQRRSSFDDISAVFKEEKARIDAELQKTELALAEFRARHPKVSSEDSGTGEDRRLDSLSHALTQAELETIRLKTEYASAAAATNLMDSDKLDAFLPAGGLTDGEIEQLRAELAAQQKKQASLARTYLPSHPAVKQTAERISELQRQYVAALKQRWLMAQQRESEIRRTLEAESVAASAARQQKSEQRATLTTLERDRERLRATSEELARKIKEVSLAVDSGLISTQVIEPPSADEARYSPQAASVLPVSGLLGLVLGSILALVRESADPRLVSPGGVRAAIGVQVLGAVPPSASGRTLETFGWAVHSDSVGAVAEALRGLRTSLQFALQESGARRIVITSPGQMDGKSTIASNLAILLAKGGKNVLLIDANLRDPVQHRIFGVSDAVGLVDVLASGELNERAIRRTTIEHLHVMPAGEVPKDPSELLNTQGFSDLLDGLAGKYDIVLIDAPAAVAVDDARIIAAVCDGALLIVRSGKTNRREAVAARDGLLSVGCRVLGAVVNGCRANGFGAGSVVSSGNIGSKARFPEEPKPSAGDSSIQSMDRSI